MRHFISGLLVLLVAGCASQPGESARITLPRSVPFSAEAGAIDAIRTECQLETNFAEQVHAAISKDFQNILRVERITPATPGRTLSARISRIETTGNGGVSFTVDGVLRDNGKVIGSFTARRDGPAITSGASRCGRLFQLSKLISQDIARWANAPSMNTQLGVR